MDPQRKNLKRCSLHARPVVGSAKQNHCLHTKVFSPHGEHDMITVLMQLINTLGENNNVRMRINNDNSSYSCLTAQPKPIRKAVTSPFPWGPFLQVCTTTHECHTEKISLCNPVLHSENSENRALPSCQPLIESVFNQS